MVKLPYSNRHRLPRCLHLEWDDIIDVYDDDNENDHDDDDWYEDAMTETRPLRPQASLEMEWVMVVKDWQALKNDGDLLYPIGGRSVHQEEIDEHERVTVPSPISAQPSIPIAKVHQASLWSSSGIAILPSSLGGPQSRGTLLVRAVRTKVVALIPFPPRPMISNSKGPIVILVGSDLTECHEAAFIQAVQHDLRDFHQRKELLGYQEMCERMADLSSNWSEMLEEQSKVIVPNRRDSCDIKRGVLLQNALKKAQLPIGHAIDLNGMFISYVEHGGVKLLPPMPHEEQTELDASAAVHCVICLDELVSDKCCFQPRACGHGVCTVCWVASLTSTPRSEQSATSCPVQGCKATLGLLDYPHILGANTALSEQETRSLFSTLTSNECRDFCARAKQGRSCPRCDTMLVHGGGKLTPDNCGRRILICPCGSTFCADCPDGESTGSHPGLRCVEYASLREEIDSGRVDEGPQSVKMIAYRTAYGRLQQLDHAIHSIGNIDNAKISQAQRVQNLDLDRQITQTEVWIRLACLERNDSRYSTDAQLSQLLTRIELLGKACAIRVQMASCSTKHAATSNEAAATCPQEAKAMVLLRKSTRDQKLYRGRHVNVFRCRRKRWDSRKDTFHALIPDPKLLSLCTMPAEQFHNEVQALIVAVLTNLCAKSTVSRAAAKHRHKPRV